MTRKFDLLGFVGRFEPFHDGHAQVVRFGLERANKVLLLVGSSRCSRSIRNPFSYDERVQLISLGLSPDERDRVVIVGVPDFHDNTAWANYVAQTVAKYADKGDRVGYLGHRKDGSSAYLDLFPAGLVEAPNFDGIDATHIRADFFGGPRAGRWAYPMTAAALDWLAGFAKSGAYANLREEWEYVRQLRAPYAALPHEPSSWTGDAVVRAQGKILMIRRGNAPGKGLWAFPGGFVERHEISLQAAIRELAEETLVRFDPRVLDGRSASEYLLNRVKADIVSEYPYRSVRGRVITRAYLFDLEAQPEVFTTGEANEIGWFTPDEIAAMEEYIFEDHALIARKLISLANNQP